MSIVDFKSYRKRKPIVKIKKTIRILFLVYVALYFYTHYNAYTPKALSRAISQIINTDLKNTAEITMQNNKTTKISSFNGGFIEADKDMLSFISTSGDKLLEIPLLYQNPNIKIGSSVVLVYNSNSYKYQIVSSFGTLYEGNSDSKILNASINDKDEYILVTDEDGYVSGISMYNDKNKEIFSWNTSKYNIIAAKSQGNVIATLCIYRENTEFKSKLILFNKHSDEIQAEFELNSSFPLDLYFLDNSNIAIILQDSICVVDEKGILINATQTSDLEAYNIDSDHNIVYAEKTFDGKTNLSVLDNSGNLVSSTTIVEEIFDIKISNNHIYILTKTSISKYDLFLNKIESNPHDGGISDIILHSNGDIYGVYSNKLIKNP